MADDNTQDDIQSPLSDSYGKYKQDFNTAQDNLLQSLNPQPFNLASALAAMSKVTPTGQFDFGAGGAELGRQQQEQEKLMPAIYEMRAKLAQRGMESSVKESELARKEKARQAQANFLANPQDKSALAEMSKYYDAKDIAELIKVTPQLRQLTGGEQNVPNPFATTLARDDLDPTMRSAVEQLSSQFAKGFLTPEEATKQLEHISSALDAKGQKETANDIRKQNNQFMQDLKQRAERTQIEKDAEKIIEPAKIHINIADATMQQLNGIYDTMDKLGKSGLPTAGHPINQLLANLPSFLPYSDTLQKDFVAQMQTLKSKAFLTGIQQMKGFGSLSNAEGAKVEKAIANLDWEHMSYEQFQKELGKIKNSVEIMKNEANERISKAQSRIESFNPTNGGSLTSQILDEANKRGR